MDLIFDSSQLQVLKQLGSKMAFCCYLLLQRAQRVIFFLFMTTKKLKKKVCVFMGRAKIIIHVSHPL